MSILNFINPFSNSFLSNTPEQSQIRNIEAHQNSIGKDEDGINWSAMIPSRVNGFIDPTMPVDSNGILFDAVFSTKQQRVSFYRSMSLYPLVKKALTVIADEIVCESTHSEVFTFGIKNVYVDKFKQSELTELQNEFNYIVNAVIKKENVWRYVYRWLVDAEQFWELCPNDDGDKLIGIKVLPAFCSLVIYDEGVPVGYLQDPRLINMDTKELPKSFTFDQVAYASYGDWVSNRNDVRGHLEAAIRPLNQLRSIEDALTVYRITRAPEKRIFNIYTGQLPPSQVPAYMQEMKGRYRKSLTLDPITGMTNASKNVQALTEDFWFSKSADGNGSTVEQFKGATEFNGQLDDVKMFQQQVMDALLIPASRWNEGENQANFSHSAETALSEITFQKMCRRLGQTFIKGMILPTFIQHLRLRKYDIKYLDKEIYDINFIPSSDFQRIRELSIAGKIAEQLTALSNFLPKYENVKPGATEEALLSKQFVFSKFLGLSEEEISLNNKLLEKEKTDILSKLDNAKAEGTFTEEDDDFAF